ncbi:hypothetical protein C0583_04570 [Candidatus Parcubacteria bacterium]|nr:MAG: hypothetical protein C0583_04570 [Candidatus Parcubacteria bacterium]
MPQKPYKIFDDASERVIGDELVEKYRNNIIDFFEGEYILEDNKNIKLEPWQKKILRSVFMKKMRGHPDVRQNRLALVMIPKKNGKSTLASGIGIWALLFDDDYPEVYICSGDLDQSRIIFRMVTNAIRRNQALFNLVNIKNDFIERKDGKGFLRAMSADAPTAHGVNPTLVIFDELWNAKSEDLFSAMTLGPTKKNGLQLVISYAGYDKDSVLYRLYKMGKTESNKRMFFYHATENPASWVKQSYLDDQKAVLHPSEYIRMHECRWVDSHNQFLDSTEVDRCVDEDLLPSQKRDSSFLYFVGLDIGLKNDKTVATVCHYDYKLNAVVLDEVASWQGTKNNPVDLQTIQDYLLDAHSRYFFRNIIVDPWQAMQLIQNLKAKCLPVEEFSFSGQNINRLAQNLFFIIHNRRLKIYNHKELIKELKTVQAIQTTYGYRIDHKSGKHDDFVISLGLASLYAVQNQKPLATPEVFLL